MRFARDVFKLAMIVVAIASAVMILRLFGERYFPASPWIRVVFIPMGLYCLIAGSLFYFEMSRKPSCDSDERLRKTSNRAHGKSDWSEYRIRAGITFTVAAGGWLLFKLFQKNQFWHLGPYASIFLTMLMVAIAIAVLLLRDYQFSVPCPRCGKPFFGGAVKFRWRWSCPNCGLRRLENP